MMSQAAKKISQDDDDDDGVELLSRRRRSSPGHSLHSKQVSLCCNVVDLVLLGCFVIVIVVLVFF